MENIDLYLWSNIVAGTALAFYAYFMWAQLRGWFVPTVRVIIVIRTMTFVALLFPVAVRFHFSGKTILVLSVVLIGVLLLVKLRNKLGI